MERKIEKIRRNQAALQLISNVIEQNKYNTSNLISISDRVYELENNNTSGTTVQANWNETNSTSNAFIQNKPDLSLFITASSTDTLTNKSISYSQLTGTPKVVETYFNTKVLSGTGVTDFFTIDRDTQRSFVIDLRIVGGDGDNAVSLYHTRTGIVFTESEISIKNTQIIANTDFVSSGSAYVTSIIESPSNIQLDIRVQSNTGSTQQIGAYMTIYGTRANPSVVIS